jgi:Tol biopolymer transport system component
VVIEAIDGSTGRETILEDSVSEVFTAGWLPDRRSHLAWLVGPSGSRLLVREPGKPPRTLLTESGGIGFATSSPDGRWAAYDSTAAGPYHIYVTSVISGGRIQVSAREGNTPRWSHDGKQLFFRSGRSMYAIGVLTTKDGIDFANERKLFDGDIARDYDVGPNGEFYTMVPAPDLAYQKQIQLRTRWFEEVDRVMKK